MGSSWSSDDVPTKEAERYQSLMSKMNSGNKRVMTDVAWFLLSGRGGATKDAKAAVELLENRADVDSDAMWMLGLCKEYAMGTEKDFSGAKELYKRSKKLGNHVGAYLCRDEIDAPEMFVESGFVKDMCNYYPVLLAIAPWNAFKSDYEIKGLSSSSRQINGNAPADAIAEALRFNSTLTYLKLRSERIGDPGVKSIVTALQFNTTLTSLDLSCNDIHAFGGELIAEMLKTNTTLKSLWINRNNICDAASQHICEVLKSNTTLTEISMIINGVSPENRVEVGEMLLVNTTLATLYYCANKLRREEARKICESLKTNTSLTHLELSLNNLEDEIAFLMSEVLMVNTTLKHLDMASNKFTSEGILKIAESLKTNTTLTELSLYGNKNSDEAWSVLKSVWEAGIEYGRNQYMCTIAALW